MPTSIDYRAESDLRAARRARRARKAWTSTSTTPAGPITDAVMQNLATHARVVIVGSISLAGKFGQPDIGPRFQRQILIARATIRGFLVSDYPPRYPEARERLMDSN